MKDQVEAEAGIKSEGQGSRVQWLIRSGPLIPPRFLVGQDDMSRSKAGGADPVAYQHKFFCEQVLYRALKTKTELMTNFQTEWKDGLRLGHVRSSNEVLIGTTEGVVGP